MGLLLYLVQLPLLEFQKLQQQFCRLRGGFLKDAVFLDQCTRFPELTDWSSSSSLLQVKCLQKGRFLEATWFLINFLGWYLGHIWGA